MNLKIYDNNSRSANHGFRAGVRSIGVGIKNGAITFSALIAKELGLNVGDHILFAQDEDNGDWFVGKTSAENGLILRAKKNGGWAKKCRQSITLYFCNRLIVSKLLDACKAKNSATFLIATKPVKADGQEWFKVVTSKPLRIK